MSFSPSITYSVERWLKGLVIRIPEDLGLIQPDRRRDHSNWSGMDQHSDIVGEPAVEILAGMIHNNENGIPAFPRASLIGSTRIEGRTTRHRTPVNHTKAR